MDSIKEIIVFAVNLIVCCAVLAMIAVLGRQTTELAQIRDEDIARSQAISEYGTSAASLDGKTLTGLEVIAIMRDNVRTRDRVYWVDVNSHETWFMNERNLDNVAWTTDTLMRNIRSDNVYTAEEYQAAGYSGVWFKYV